jgi:hypothetical protein
MRERYSSGTARSVLGLAGRGDRISASSRKTCLRPFFGGTKRSIWSEKRMRPMRSLFLTAEKANSPVSMAATVCLSSFREPKRSDADTSTISMMVSSRSSTKRLM